MTPSARRARRQDLTGANDDLRSARPEITHDSDQRAFE